MTASAAIEKHKTVVVVVVILALYYRHTHVHSKNMQSTQDTYAHAAGMFHSHNANVCSSIFQIHSCEHDYHSWNYMHAQASCCAVTSAQ